MTKFIALCTKIIITIIIAFLFSSCRYNIEMGDGIEGNGIQTSEKRTISEKFTKVSVDSGIEITVEQSNSVSVEVEAEENIISHLTTKVENGVLVISYDKSVNNTDSPSVKITMPVIDELHADSGATITSVNTLKNLSQNSNLKIDADSSAIIELNIEYDTTVINSDSSAEIKIAGKTLKLETHADSSSSIDASKLLANDVISTADSAASITVYPILSLDASADSGALISYNNIPKTISKKEDSAGVVSEK